MLDFARCATAAHIERLVRVWRRVDRIDAAEDERRRHASRHLDTWVDVDGMLVVHGRLSREVGAVVQRALEAAADQLYHESEDKTEVSAGQRRADRLGLLAESALAGHLGLTVGRFPRHHRLRCGLDLRWSRSVPTWPPLASRSTRTRRPPTGTASSSTGSGPSTCSVNRCCATRAWTDVPAQTRTLHPPEPAVDGPDDQPICHSV